MSFPKISIIPFLLVIVVLTGFFFLKTKDDSPTTANPANPNPSSGQILFPTAADSLIVGQSYTLKWTGKGDDPIAIFLIDASLEPQGASAAIVDRLYDIADSGSYDYTVPDTLAAGSYKFQIGTLTSDYFQIAAAAHPPATVTGQVICLPHKDTSGPVTLECALGLKGDDGQNYGLNDTRQRYVGKFDTGKKIKVTGNLLPPDDSKYDISGSIEVETLEVL